MIEPVILEIPNPGHPYGVRGVGETSIVPPLAAINNAVSRATNIRFSDDLSGKSLLKFAYNKGETKNSFAISDYYHIGPCVPTRMIRQDHERSKT